MMRWASIDPANKAGIAYWDGEQLTGTVILKRVGAKGKFSLDGVIFLNRFTAWKEALESCAAIVTEEGCGRFATAIKSQAGMRGYIEAVCDYIRLRNGDANAVFATVNVSEWRRVIKEAYGVSWPATTERKKALSVQLVRQHYGIEVTNDEADAVLLGVAAMRTGIVKTTQFAKGGAAEQELNDFNSLFDLQRKRSIEASKLWQKDTGEKCNPDLGELLRYFMAQRELLDRFYWMLREGKYGSDEYADVMESYERKDFCRSNSAAHAARKETHG